MAYGYDNYEMQHNIFKEKKIYGEERIENLLCIRRQYLIKIEKLINKIIKIKKIDNSSIKKINSIHKNILQFGYNLQNNDTIVQSYKNNQNNIATLGVFGGLTVTCFGEEILRGWATTFCKSGTGVPISQLTGFYQENAILAQIGGGVLGSNPFAQGMAGGQAVLNWLPIIGIGIAVGSLFYGEYQKKKKAEEYEQKANEIQKVNYAINEMCSNLNKLIKITEEQFMD